MSGKTPESYTDKALLSTNWANGASQGIPPTHCSCRELPTPDPFVTTELFWDFGSGSGVCRSKFFQIRVSRLNLGRQNETPYFELL